MTKKKFDNQPAKTSVILVVDDNRENLERSRPALRISTAGQSPPATGRSPRYHQKDKPDLILLDIMMPKMSGFEVCRRVKNDPSTAHIP